jgi:16S rRNA processing protein RimM
MKYITTGKIINSRGLTGELKVYSTTDFAAKRYKKGSEIFFYHPDKQTRESKIVKKYQFLSGFDYLQVEGIATVEHADLYRGYLIQVAEEQRGKLPKGTYYHSDLLTCEVYDSQDHLLGRVIEIIDNGAQTILRVEKEGKTRLIPFLAPFLKEVDLINHRITIQEIEGLV